MGDSIFKFADKFGYESPFGDWIEKKLITSNSSKGAVTSGSTNVILLTKDRIFALKTDILLRFKFYGPDRWYNTPDSTVVLTSSDSTLDIKQASSWIVENGNEFLVEIALNKEAKVKLYMTIDKVRKITFDIEFKKSKDVFTEKEVERLTSEYRYVASFTNLEPDDKPAEYAGNYCMHGADRAIGKLLNNYRDFYLVEHGSHRVQNSINFSAGDANTYSRAGTMNIKGYVDSTYSIENKNWIVNHNLRETMNSKYPPYKVAQAYARTILYDIAWVKESSGYKFYLWLKEKCDQVEPGYHVYYLSVVDGFHTQILIIDNSNRDSPKYEIWDDHGITTSKGKLRDIANGINRQTSSMFASSCLIRLDKGTSNQWDSQKLKVWKIKKK